MCDQTNEQNTSNNVDDDGDDDKKKWFFFGQTHTHTPSYTYVLVAQVTIKLVALADGKVTFYSTQ